VMDENGTLIDGNGQAVPTDSPNREGYRYERDNETAPDTKSLEERERIWKEEGERIRKEKTKSQTNDTTLEESMDEEEPTTAFEWQSPVSTFVKFF